MKFFLITIIIFGSVSGYTSQASNEKLSLNLFCRTMSSQLSFEELKKWIKWCKPKTVAQVVKKLPKSFRANTTFIHTSKSKSELEHPGTVTPLYPRAILFGNKRFVITFTGKPGTPSYQEIETLEYNPKTYKFDLALIKINSDGSSSFQKNPSSCIKCHSKRSLPIWDGYNEWPGAYGEHDDFLGNMVNDYYDFSHLNSKNPDRKRHVDKKNINYMHGDGRYKALDDKKDPLEYRYANEKPNRALSVLFAQQVAHSFVADLKKLPEFSSLYKAILAEKLSCKNISNKQIKAFIERNRESSLYEEHFSDYIVLSNYSSKYMPSHLPKKWIKYNPDGSGVLLPLLTTSWIVSDNFPRYTKLSSYFDQSGHDYNQMNQYLGRSFHTFNFSEEKKRFLCEKLEPFF